MHLHLPKPLHGWRAFVGEVGIIVLGVLIALGAEQTVEWVHWKHKANGALELLRKEVAGHFGTATEAVIAAPCIDRQLQMLETRLSVRKAASNQYLPIQARLVNLP